ncbi:NAD(P)-dependent alcohol dehydrogenase [Paeniglutamicibacter sulfureus]|uniref:L-iditol 2-dehydrogenase n=1 Tax=Paeniglutamicibacter sulfureus TaxID=43666 RepID=A0ABU2BK10_9MICC|nr:NAD(P)-dependent alcohol dehydrogenase [Paeniglutamicibacter sulfureus]MDR7358063.1 L-iditol 2-dehydrogenase [Paeniglutamicibacter sulfureus]
MREPLPTEMRASVLRQAGEVVVENRPVPVPASDEVLVRVGSVGICGSDVHYFKEGRIGDFVVESPLVLGHEAGGVIVAVGADVDPARVGERVSIEPQRPSPTSKQTMSGAYNLCPHMEFYATPPIDGAFAEYVTIQSHFAFAVPENISDDAAALMEPLSVGIAAARKAGITAGSRVLVTGAGPIGIIALQVARAFGATEVIVSDLDAERRAQALAFGADRVLDAIADDAELRGLGMDVLLECSGATPAVRAGLEALAPAGVAVLVGMGADEIALPIPLIQNRELVVTGIFRYNNTWPTAIDLVRTGRVDLDGLVTGGFGLDEVEAALLASTASTSLKTMIRPGNGA